MIASRKKTTPRSDLACQPYIWCGGEKTYTNRPRAFNLISSPSTDRISRTGLPSFENSRNSVPIEGELSNEEYFLRSTVGVDGAGACRWRLPMDCLIDSMV